MSPDAAAVPSTMPAHACIDGRGPRTVENRRAARAILADRPRRRRADARAPDHEQFRMARLQQRIELRAGGIVETMITRQIVPVSWRTVRPSFRAATAREGVDEWVVDFDNPPVNNPAQRRLFVVLSLYGDYIAANFTGR